MCTTYLFDGLDLEDRAVNKAMRIQFYLFDGKLMCSPSKIYVTTLNIEAKYLLLVFHFTFLAGVACRSRIPPKHTVLVGGAHCVNSILFI